MNAFASVADYENTVRVPDGWEIKELRDLGQVKVGLTYKPENMSEFGTLVLRSSNIQNDRLTFDDNVFVDIPVREGATVRTGDLLICVRNGSRRLIGKTAMIDERANGMAFGAFMSAFRSDLNPYLIWLFQSQIIQRQVEENLGATINQITNAALKGFKIPLPNSKKEQEAIAEALSDADTLIEGLERLIAKKRLIKQGAMQDLLTAKRRLPGFSGEWKVRKFGALLTVRHGRSQKDVESPSGPYPILATGGQIGTADSFLWNKPSVLIGRKGTIDRPQFIEVPFWTVDTLFYTDIVAPNDPRFLFYVFQRIDWQSYNEASGVPSLNAKTIESIDVEVPDAPEQIAISAVLKDMDTEIQALESRLEKARQVKEGMMQNLLTGRIRLV